MNFFSARRCLVSVALLVSAFGAWTCGGKVVLDGDYSQGGDGGASSSSSVGDGSGVVSSTSAQVTSGSGLSCTDESCSGLGSNDCGCIRTCGSSILEVKCALNENKKLQCICSYDDVFSGACFETQEALACNIDKGCCAKYFMGI